MTLRRLPVPVDEFDVLRRTMERMFQEPFFRPMPLFRYGEESAWPQLDLYSTDDAHMVEVALPGVKPEDVKITVEGGTLTISGTYEHAADRTEAGYSVREIREGAFRRSLTLGSGIQPDRIKAEFQGGLLKLTVPRAEEAKPRLIDVNVT